MPNGLSGDARFLRNPQLSPYLVNSLPSTCLVHFVFMHERPLECDISCQCARMLKSTHPTTIHMSKANQNHQSDHVEMSKPTQG